MDQSKVNNIKGFTLMEIIIVIVILGILATIAVPRMVGYIKNANIAVDKQNVELLNRVTTYYASLKEKEAEDVFQEISTDNDRMEVLVSSGYLKEIMTPLVSDTTFSWSIDYQKWMYSLLEVATNNMSVYDFKNSAEDSDLSSYTKTGTWKETDDGITSKWGLLFIDNPREEYTITANTTLATGKSGGYGILFETSLDGNKDTGYALQFDRGYAGGKIIIRPRTGGKESGAIADYALYHDDGTRIEKSDSWWSEKHEVALKVEKVADDTSMKKVSLFIDDELIIENFEVESNISSENNFTGFRSWGKSITTYENLNVTGD